MASILNSRLNQQPPGLAASLRTIEYLIEENRVHKLQIDGRRLRLANDQRRRLAEKGKQLGRRLLGRVVMVVMPDTIWAGFGR